jgi:hypothetical protein
MQVELPDALKCKSARHATFYLEKRSYERYPLKRRQKIIFPVQDKRDLDIVVVDA